MLKLNSIIGAFSVGVIVPVIVVGYLGFRYPAKLLSLWRQDSPATIIDVRSVIVAQSQHMADLATISQKFNTILPAQETSKIWGVIPQTATLKYMVEGQVKAGVPMSIAANQIVRSGDTIMIRLPPPKIISIELDNSKSVVYDSVRDLGAPDSATLLNDAQAQLSQRLIEASCNSNLMVEAGDRAKQILTQILSPQIAPLSLQIAVAPPNPQDCIQSAANPQ